MLTHLTIRDFTIVDALGIDFAGGFSAITGETGAGKSIMLDALGLVLGDRASAELIRPDAGQAEVSAEFDLTRVDDARAWLEARALADAEDPQCCLLRRVVARDGRSRAFVNGRPTNVSALRELAGMLIDIQGQHAHQSLLRREVQRRLLDEYGGYDALAASVHERHRHWRGLADELAALQQAGNDADDRRQLLAYQLEELDTLALGDDELEAIEREHRRLAGADANAARVEGVRAALDGEVEGAGPRDALARLEHTLGDIDDEHAALATTRELLAGARVHMDEASDELRRYAAVLEPDPARLADLDARLETVHDLARKHRCRPEDLPAHHRSLRAELDTLAASETRLDTLVGEVEAARESCLTAARALSEARQEAAARLEPAVTEQLHQLGMQGARFEIGLEPHPDAECGPQGLEQVELRVAANAGTRPGPLGKLASGGELSRIALAIEVVTAETSRIPSLVLDEADVGLGGGTAEVVGRLLRRLGARTQVLCVTHLPQVAALGHRHMAVEKITGEQAASTRIVPLDDTARVGEVARMLGGMEITERTRAHASEMLERAARETT